MQRKIDYGDPGTNQDAEMKIPASWPLYHATRENNLSSLAQSIRTDVSMTTQLGKGFYTSWFGSGLEKYGTFVVRFNLNREIKGQQVFSDRIRDAEEEEKRRGPDEKAIKAVKGNWDIDNDFLYTPKLDTHVNGQDIPHQVKLTDPGVAALTGAMVIDTGTKQEKPLDSYKSGPGASGSAARKNMFAELSGKKKGNEE